MPRIDKVLRNQYNNEWLKKKRRGPKGDLLRLYHKKYVHKWRNKNPERNKSYQKTYQERLEYNREYNRKNAKRLSEKKRIYYLEHKNWFKEYGKKHYQQNKKIIAERARILREEVLKNYGKKCVCCGETEVKFLALDHKNNDGVRHRKEIKQNKMYRWAKQNNYPDILQILCHNCNLAKAFYGSCPHKKEKHS